MGCCYEHDNENYSQLKEDCLVLTAIENGLWDIGRIVAMDKEESAVKLLKSGKEISSQTSALIPLGDISDSAGIFLRRGVIVLLFS